MLRIISIIIVLSLSLNLNAQTVSPDASGTVYVDITKSGNGTSWGNAIKELADALKAAKTNTSIKQIFVAKGMYKPMYLPTTLAASTSRDITFSIPKDVKLYGGFDPINGIIDLSHDRIFGNQGTVLSGTINANNDVYHVVMAIGRSGTNIIDGFTIINGNASINTNLKIENIDYNRSDGAAIYSANSINIINCNFQQNRSSGWGGIIALYTTGTATIDKCILQNNIGGSNVIDCGIPTKVLNTLITNNTGAQSSAVNAWNANVEIINSTIANNISSEGSAIYLETGGKTIKIYNSIVYGNQPQDLGRTATSNYKLYAYNSLLTNISILTSPTTGSIFGQDPKFITPIVPGLAAGGNYRVDRTSPAIDKGDDLTNTAGYALQVGDLDLQHEKRIANAKIDIGAYELPSNNIISPLADLFKTYGDADFEINTSASSSLPVTFASENTSIATVYQDLDDGDKWKVKLIKAGSVDITINQSGNQNFDPATEVRFKLTIQKKPLTLNLSNTPIITKVYNGNNAATIPVSKFDITGIVGTDNVSISAAATYDDKNAGVNKAISISNITLTGNDASNYSLNTTSLNTVGNITKKLIQISGGIPASELTKIYDGNTTALLTGFNYSTQSIISGDQVVVTRSTSYFHNKNVGTNILITINFDLTGFDAVNYMINPLSFPGAITAKPLSLTISNTPTITKVYDGHTTATVPASQFSLTGVVGSEDVSFSAASSTYADQHVGNAKVITISGITLAGADKDNYSLSASSLTTSGSITTKPISLTINSNPIITKVYDGHTIATIPASQFSLTGLVGSEDVSFSTANATYADQHVGNAKAITISGITLAGADKDNYSLSASSLTTSGNITPRELSLTINNTPTITKVYDGHTTATIPASQFSLTGVVGSEDVSFSTANATYADQHVGNAKAITISGITLAGADKDNYSLSASSLTTSGNITQKPLSLTVNSNPIITKVYDGHTIATIPASQFTLTGFVGSEDVSFSTANATYADQHVGNAKAITISGITLAGADKNNYSLSTSALTTSGNITPRELSLTINNTPTITKVYDGHTTATIPASQFSLTGLVGSEDVSFSTASSTYADQHVGNAKVITISGITLAGADKDNYSLSVTSLTTSGSITAKPLTLTVSNTPAISKVYDGSTAASISASQFTLTGIVGSEDVNFTSTSTAYADKNIGAAKNITINGIALGGADKANYSLSTSSLSTSGSITAKPLTLSVSNTPAITKMYDGSNTATIPPTQFSLTGVVGSEDVNFTSTSTAYDDKNVGSAKAITISGIALGGADKDNYSLSVTSLTTNGSISAKPLTLTVSNTPAISKVYDGNTAATIPASQFVLTGIVGSEDVNFTSTSTAYDDKNVGTAKDITISGIALDGADKDNYSLSLTSLTTNGSITAKPLTLTVSNTPAITKMYDGSNTATIPASQFSLTGVVGSEDVSFTSTSTAYDDKNVGSTKAITINGIALSGSDKNNYSLSTSSLSTSGSITAKPLTLSVSNTPAISKVYNGSTAATIPATQFSLTGVVGSEDVNFTSTSTAYDDRNVGSAKAITINGIALGGADKDNYSLSVTSLTTSGSITAKPLTLTVSNTPAISKVYDGSTAASIPESQFSLTGVVGSEEVSFTATGSTYDNKNVGVNKSILIHGIALSGADKDNYSLSSSSLSTSGDITAKSISVSISSTPAISKIYDGTNDAFLIANHYVINGSMPSDMISVSGIAKYDNKAWGNQKVITVSSLILNGADRLNYLLINNVATTTGSIVALPTNVVWNTPSDIIYGTALGINQLNASSSVSGTFSYTPAVGSLLDAGNSQPIQVTFTPTDLDAYEMITKSVNINVLKRDLIVKVNDAQRCDQTSNPNFTIVYNGFINGQDETVLNAIPTISSEANHASSPGNYLLRVAGGISNNYNFVYQNGTLTINALPVIGITSSNLNFTIDRGESITINASGGSYYTWKNQTNTVIGIGSSITIIPDETHTYTLEVTNNSGCVTTKNFSVNVIQSLKVPNIFSPNGDGVHDTWAIKYIEQYPNALVQVFDMSGARVFLSRGYANAFDGTFNSQPLKPGIYYYVIDLNNNTKAYTGSLTIIR